MCDVAGLIGAILSGLVLILMFSLWRGILFDKYSHEMTSKQYIIKSVISGLILIAECFAQYKVGIIAWSIVLVFDLINISVRIADEK